MVLGKKKKEEKNNSNDLTKLISNGERIPGVMIFMKLSNNCVQKKDH